MNLHAIAATKLENDFWYSIGCIQLRRHSIWIVEVRKYYNGGMAKDLYYIS